MSTRTPANLGSLVPLSCALKMVEDCVVTPCGHSFCRKCAGDAITRKHCCPVCQVGVIGGEAGLIRNFLVDEVTSTLKKSTEDTDFSYMRLLFKSATCGIVGNDRASHPASLLPQPPRLGNADDAASNDEASPCRGEAKQQQGHQGEASLSSGCHGSPLDLSPVEAILVKRMREAFLGYQSYYDRERAAHEAEVRGLRAQLLAAQQEEDMGVSRDMGEPSEVAPAEAGRARKVAALQEAIEDSGVRLKAGMEALLQDFDTHAKNAAPPPSLLPSTVTVIVASRGIRFNAKVLPTDFPENIYGKVGARFLFWSTLLLDGGR